MAVTLTIDIKLNSQSIANNTSNVTVNVNAKWTNGSYNQLQKSGWLQIDGTKYNFTSPFNYNRKTSGVETLFTKTVDVKHDSDGTKTLVCKASYDRSSSETIGASVPDYELPTIPRKSTLSVGDGKLGVPQTLTVTEQASSFTHTITAKCGSASAVTICTKSTNNSISFTPPLSWASQNTTGESVSVVYTITTYNGSTSVGSNTYTKKCSIPSSVVPNCTVSVTDITGTSDIDGINGYVKGVSKLKVVITPDLSNNYGAGVKSYRTTIDGRTYTTATFTTDVLSKSGTLPLTVTVTDTRGRGLRQSVNIPVHDYSPPVVSKLTVHRCSKVESAEEYNEIAKATEVSTFEELKTYNGNAILRSYRHENNGGVSNASYDILKIPVLPGDVIRDMLGSYWKKPSNNSPWVYAFFYDASNTIISKVIITYDGYTGTTATTNYLDLRENGLTAPEGTTYVMINLFSTYERLVNGSYVSTGTLRQSNIVTVNKSADLTYYDGTTNLEAYAPPEGTDEEYIADDAGEFVKVIFDASVTDINGTNTSTMYLEYKKTSESEFGDPIYLHDDQISVTDYTYIFPADSGSSYDVRVTMEDVLGKPGSRATTVSTGFTTMHVSASGRSMSIGKVSELEDVFDVGLQTRLAGGLLYPVLPSETDLNTLLIPNFYVGNNVSSNNYGHCPVTSGTFTLEVKSAGPSGQIWQILTVCDKNRPVVYERFYYGGNWANGASDDGWRGGWIYPTLSSEFIMYGTSESDNRPRYRKDGRVVEVRGIVTPSANIPYVAGEWDDNHTIFTLPDGYRPSSPIYVLCQGSGACVWMLRVSTSGTVDFTRYRNGDVGADANSGCWLPFHVTFLV